MKITISLLLFLCLFSNLSFAQNPGQIKGSVTDTVAKSKLQNTSISVLNAKDSTLVSYTRADASGAFEISNLKKGKFILLVTYPDYADYVEQFSLDSAKNNHDFGKLSMLLKTRLLADVIIKGKKAAIKIKGDTTEFNASSFTVQPNAKVEDLLKQLPGITVDKDGKITAQGETVNKVLVDGEEFFGDDPTLVTKNVRADMVDKVQLFDKKSDQATFTGIDDGQKTKTLNIKLKEDKKNGYFGKADVGYGTDGYYQTQLLFNKFKAKMKFSAYTTVSNNGKTGLGWQDNQKYGSSDNVTVMDNGGIMISGNSGDDLDSWNGNYNGKGIPIAMNSGIHYDTKWNKSDKESLNTNYKIGTLTVDGTDNTLSQNNLATTTINTADAQTYHNYMFRNKLDVTYQNKLDTTSNIKLMAGGSTKHSQTKSDDASTSIGDYLLNNSDKSITNTVDTKIFDISAFYTKKFKKKGRTFSWNLSEVYNESQAHGNLKSHIDFFNSKGGIDSSQIVDQYKTNDLKNSIFNSNMTYTEPFSKTFSVVLNYGLGIDNNNANRKSFNKAADGSYTVFDSKYSNNYRLNQLSNQGGAVFNYKKGKTTLNFGTKVTDVSFKQINEYTGDVFKRNFINWAPQASYQYKFNQMSNFSLNYSGSATQPTVEQIQPVLVNNDPLALIIGNPALTPSFTNNIRINYNSYKVLSEQYLGIYGNYSFTSNPIVTSIVTEALTGHRNIQYVNLNQTPTNYYISTYFGRKVSSDGLSIGFDLNANGNKNYNLSNGETNIITSNSYTGSLQIQKYVEKKYDFNISFGPNLSYGGSSLQQNINNNGHGWNGYGGFDIYLPGKVSIGSDANYQYNSATQTFSQDYTKVLWNAHLTKAFNKAENIKVTLTCNDILNQNSGFDRSSNAGLITQNTYTTIKRYFMLSLVWDFNKMGGITKK
jgi:hypothetical protein